MIKLDFNNLINLNLFNSSLIFFIIIFSLKIYYKFQKIKKFRGIDKKLITDDNMKHTNIIFSKIKYDMDSDIFIKLLKERIINYLNKNNCILRYNIYKNDKNYYYYNDEKSEEYLNKILIISDELPSYQYLENYHINTNFGLILFLSKKEKILCSSKNHLLIDGIRYMFFLGEILDNKILDDDFIPNFTYYPLITELLVIHKLPYLLTNNYNRQLSLYEKWWENKNIFNNENKINVKSIKSIKNELEIYNKSIKFKFNFILTSLILVNVLDNIITNKNIISVAIVVGFQNNYSFNNYSILNLYITKNNNWNILSNIDKILNIYNQINNHFNNVGRQQIILTYLAANIYELNHKKNSYDILIANLPSRYPLKFNNNLLSFNSYYLPYISFPLYCCCITDNDIINIYYTSRTNEVNNEKLGNLNYLFNHKKNI